MNQLQEYILNQLYSTDFFRYPHEIKKKKSRGYSIRIEFFLYDTVKEAYKDRLQDLKHWFVSQQLEEVRQTLNDMFLEIQGQKYIIYTDNIKEFKNKKDEGEEIVYVIPFFYTTL